MHPIQDCGLDLVVMCFNPRQFRTILWSSLEFCNFNTLERIQANYFIGNFSICIYLHE